MFSNQVFVQPKSFAKNYVLKSFSLPREVIVIDHQLLMNELSGRNCLSFRSNNLAAFMSVCTSSTPACMISKLPKSSFKPVQVLLRCSLGQVNQNTPAYLSSFSIMSFFPHLEKAVGVGSRNSSTPRSFSQLRYVSSAHCLNVSHLHVLANRLPVTGLIIPAATADPEFHRLPSATR